MKSLDSMVLNRGVILARAQHTSRRIELRNDIAGKESVSCAIEGSERDGDQHSIECK